MTRLTEILAGPWTAADQRRLDRFLKETPMPYVRFQTSNLALVRNKLAAAKLLHGPLADSINRPITLSVLPAPGINFLLTTDGEEIWCRGTAEPVHKLGRRYAHLLDCKLSPAAQHDAPLWVIDLGAVES